MSVDLPKSDSTNPLTPPTPSLQTDHTNTSGNIEKTLYGAKQIKSTPGSVLASGLGKLFATPANIAGAFGAALGGALGALVGNAARGAQIGGTLVTGAAALTLGLPATALGLACACLSQKLSGNPEIKFSEAVKDSNWLLGALYPEKSGKSVQEQVKNRAIQEIKSTDMRLQDFYTFDPNLKLPAKDKEEIKNILTSPQFSELLKESKESVVVKLAVGKQEKEEYTIDSINKESLTLEVSIRQKDLLKMEEINISDISELDAFNNTSILKIREDLAKNTSVAEEPLSALPTTPSNWNEDVPSFTNDRGLIKEVLDLPDEGYKTQHPEVIINGLLLCKIVGRRNVKVGGRETFMLKLESKIQRMNKEVLVDELLGIDVKKSSWLKDVMKARRAQHYKGS